MTSADTSDAALNPSFAEPRGGTLRRLVATFAVSLAILSAVLTFVVLTGLTRIEPTREVEVTFMLINGATILVLVGIIIREVWQVTLARRRGRAAARSSVCSR
jgi:two-component system nitrogen regulation sensor histidine kinase NtrY